MTAPKRKLRLARVWWLTLVLALLKLSDLVPMSWWWVASPLLAPWVAIAAMLAGGGVLLVMLAMLRGPE